MDTNLDVCLEIQAHPDIVERINKNMPPVETLYELADFFRTFGDTTRIRILYALEVSELCVCDIAAILQLTQSAVSHQLKELKTARLVKARRDGKSVLYSLDDAHVRAVIEQGIEHIKER